MPTSIHSCSDMPANITIAHDTHGYVICVNDEPIISGVKHCPWCGANLNVRDIPLAENQMVLDFDKVGA